MAVQKRFAVVVAALLAAVGGARAAVLKMEAGTCAPGDFMCFDGEGCLAQEKVCDGVADCLDETDEYACDATGDAGTSAEAPPPEAAPAAPTAPTAPSAVVGRNVSHGCLPGEHQCVDGTCLSGARVCNGRAECVDGSDELDKLCQEKKAEEEEEEEHAEDKESMQAHPKEASAEVTSSAETLEVTSSAEVKVEALTWPRNCTFDQFRCNSGQCVSASAICNSRRDCRDGSDEEVPCPTKGPCQRDAFACANGECVPLAWRCDGHPECRDASDEWPQHCEPGAMAVESKPDAPAPSYSWPGDCKGMKPPMLQECREAILHELQVEALQLQQQVAREALENARHAATNAKTLYLEQLQAAQLQREAAADHRRQQQMLFVAQMQAVRSKESDAEPSSAPPTAA